MGNKFAREGRKPEVDVETLKWVESIMDQTSFAHSFLRRAKAQLENGHKLTEEQVGGIQKIEDYMYNEY